MLINQLALPALAAGAPAGPPPALKMAFPTWPGWNVVKEGENLQFGIKVSGGRGGRIAYKILRGKVEGMEFDSLGRFSWTPAFDFADRENKNRSVPVQFEARSDKGERVTKTVEFRVEHVNRPPLVAELKPFYVGYNIVNTYTIDPAAIQDEDGDVVTFVPISNAMPEGAKLSAKGEFTWKPSLTQFNRLRSKPLVIEFYVEDHPAKTRTKGQFKVEVTQQDLPPSIQMVPSQKRFQFKEDATVNLKFQVYDPNGDNDITMFNFISERTEVPANALVKNNSSQYEFIWKPGYDFVKDPQDSLGFHITFFVVDQTNKQEERRVRFTVLNAVNEAERDQKLYNDYRAALVRAWDLMEQLKETENELKKKYKKAQRGKKGRSVTNASLGATTGIAPVVIDDPAQSKKVSIVGGTTVMTIGTLEATEVFGRSAKDLVERLNYIIEKRNELQTKGDIFARGYSSKASRRRPEFMKAVDDFIGVMNLKGLVALELDASWQNKQEASHQNVSKTFKDFSAD
ncbi:MAG: hypothetical protein ACO1O1_10180 [Adhaeribacter sp.]